MLGDRWKKIKEWCKKNSKFVVPISFIIILSFMIFVPTNQIKDKPEQAKVADVGKVNEVSYVQFQKMLKEKKIASATIHLNNTKFKFEDKQKKIYETENPKTENFKETLLTSGVKVTEIDKRVSDQIFALLRSLLPMLLFIGLLIYLSKGMKPFSSTMKENADIPNIKFEDVAGNAESKEEMKFLVDFLKKPERFNKMGAKLPKGVILYGDPGTGKTLIAKAIAGEAKVPFFSISGSDFVEMYVGLGAKRVRELFDEARKKAPAIIFIDEIDSLGSNRDMNSNSEDRKTLNAILNELDGFKENSGIVVIGATNRLEDLDPAFIRPGRFDKHISIGLPDKNARLEILNLHAKNKQFASDVDLIELSKITHGMSGAYLETILNEATILATTRNHEVITNEDVDDAYYKMVVKGHKRKRQEEDKEKEIELVAWHEAGHALVAKLTGRANVAKVTITPSTTGIGGFALITPKKNNLRSKEDMKNEVKELYGGRVAEFLLLNDKEKITIGAGQDIKQATKVLQDMILHCGMSDRYGMVNLSLIGDPRTSNLSNNPLFVEEITSLSNSLYNETVQLLTNHKDTLKAIADRLIEKETIDEDELDQIINTIQILK